MARIEKHYDVNGNETKVSAVKVLDSKGQLLAAAPNVDLAVKQATTNYRVSRETAFKNWQTDLIEIGKSLNNQIDFYNDKIKTTKESKYIWRWCLYRAETLRNDLRTIYKMATIQNYSKIDIFRALPTFEVFNTYLSH